MAPVTAHVGFLKGCWMMEVEVRLVPIDKKTLRVKPYEFIKYIDKNTVSLFVSAPDFAYGIMDPIKEVSEIAMRRGIGCHVDSCLGGFMLCFMEKAGFDIPPYDFRLPGVTSLSCDTHKYGFAPKGTSLLVFKNEEWRSNLYFGVHGSTLGPLPGIGFRFDRPQHFIVGAWTALIKTGH